MRHLHALLPLLALTACDIIDPKPNDDNTVIAKGPASFPYVHEKHKLILSVGSLVAHTDPTGVSRPTYTAPYAVTTLQPFAFTDSVVITCNVYDADNVLVGGAGFAVGQAPIGGLVTFQLARTVEDGHLVCTAANGKGFTSEVFDR